MRESQVHQSSIKFELRSVSRRYCAKSPKDHHRLPETLPKALFSKFRKSFMDIHTDWSKLYRAPDCSTKADGHILKVTITYQNNLELRITDDIFVNIALNIVFEKKSLTCQLLLGDSRVKFWILLVNFCVVTMRYKEKFWTPYTYKVNCQLILEMHSMEFWCNKIICLLKNYSRSNFSECVCIASQDMNSTMLVGRCECVMQESNKKEHLKTKSNHRYIRNHSVPRSKKLPPRL
jgi:hypothetical protein